MSWQIFYHKVGISLMNKFCLISIYIFHRENYGALEFESNLGLVKAEVRAGINEDYAKKKDRPWIIWETFCAKTNIDPFLIDIEDPLPYLKIFGRRLCNGQLAPSSCQIRSATVSDYLTSVGQRFTSIQHGG